MSERYQIIVNGSLMEGAGAEQTQAKIAQLFKTTVDKVAPMFSGQKIAIKKDLDADTAKKYRAAIMQAGLRAGIAPMEGSVPATAPTAPTDSEQSAEDDKAAPNSQAENKQEAPGIKANPQAIDADLAPVGSIVDDSPPAETPNIDTSAYDMDQLGVIMDNRPPPPAPDIDTSQFNVAEVGVTMDETPPIPEPEIDTSQFNVAEVGVTMDETPPPAEPEIDISQLNMAAAGETIMEHPAVPEPNIDTSKLKLDG